VVVSFEVLESLLSVRRMVSVRRSMILCTPVSCPQIIK